MTDKKKHKHEEELNETQATAGEMSIEDERVKANFDALQSQLAEAEAKASEFKDSWARSQAEFQNYKKRIERDLGVSKGIVNSNLDLKDKVVTITYNTKKTSPEKIKQVISKIGYDADEIIADQKSHDALPDCCQKTSTMHVD